VKGADESFIFVEHAAAHFEADGAAVPGQGLQFNALDRFLVEDVGQGLGRYLVRFRGDQLQDVLAQEFPGGHSCRRLAALDWPT
jgi:hypothetical protein